MTTPSPSGPSPEEVAGTVRDLNAAITLAAKMSADGRHPSNIYRIAERTADLLQRLNADLERVKAERDEAIAEIDRASGAAAHRENKAGVEAAELRAAMLSVGRAVGGGLADTVSHAFLLQVPTEVEAFVRNANASRIAAAEQMREATLAAFGNDLNAASLRLHMGELSAQEVRAIRAFVNWRADVARSLPIPDEAKSKRP